MPPIVRSFARSAHASARAGSAHLEDRLLGLFGVADGLGPGAGGRYAATLALGEAHDAFESWADELGVVQLIAQSAHGGLVRAFQAAAAALHDESRSGPYRGIAASMTLAFAHGQRVLVISVGDTQALLLRAGEAIPLTRVDTVAAEYARAGRIEPGDAAGHPFARVLVRALGSRPRVDYDLLGLQLLPGDAVVLATNGVAAHGERLDTLARDGRRDAPEQLVERLLASDGDWTGSAVVLKHEGLAPTHAPLRSRFIAHPDDGHRHCPGRA